MIFSVIAMFVSGVITGVLLYRAFEEKTMTCDQFVSDVGDGAIIMIICLGVAWAIEWWRAGK